MTSAVRGQLRPQLARPGGSRPGTLLPLLALAGAIALLLAALMPVQVRVLALSEDGRAYRPYDIDYVRHALVAACGETDVRLIEASSASVPARLVLLAPSASRRDDPCRIPFTPGSGEKRSPRAMVRAIIERQHQLGGASLPRELAEFRRSSAYRSWPRKVVTDSQAKSLPRIVYRNPDGEWRMSVAETLRPDGSIRETEIVRLRGSPSGGVEFFVYGPGGRLALEADFGTLERPLMLRSPDICARCHYDAAVRDFVRVPTFARLTDR